ncbi:immunoglobulin-like domain-containing protein [Aliarcobacter cryaerophilus]|uniref:immunoglobulin-like domain-containing protein n=1 Tax=Aliarcobacter cryaerophilus TaxID=28198 RepID=UPI0021B1CD66|nr:immunoglobulin-like domain-containing protein [Aliarcobacter cryaerophilus]MCT7543505.1 hypothetical protein [Aliarcobacter cryaerophilus]
MANLAQIQSIAQGQFFVKDSLGNLTELKVGDTVSLNDAIVAASSNTDLSKIEILFDTNELITLSQGEQLLDTTLLASTFGNEELAFDKQEVDETLNAWNNAQDGDATDMETAAGDVTEQATNAGDERAADGGALRSKFNSRDGSSTDVRSDLRDTSFGGGNTEEPQEQIPTELLNPVGATTPTTPTIPVDTRVPASVITLSDPIVKEGNQITIVATVTNPPQTDLIITLSNGKTTQTITIPAGQTTGSVTFDNPNSEDVYIDNSTETYTITGTTGGNYVSLDTSDSSVVTIEDTDTQATVTITANSVKEGQDIVFTATVDTDKTPKDAPLVISVKDSNGNEVTTITIPVGQTTGSSNPVTNPNGEDVYKDGSTLNYTTEVKSGGTEYELPLNTTPVTVDVTDTIDTVTVNLTASTVNEDASDTSYVFTATLSEKSQGVTTIVTDKGTIEIADGQTTGTLKIASNQTGDVYLDASELTATITSATGGNFENLVVGNASATAKVTDTETPVTVNLTASTVDEDATDTSYVFTATLSEKSQGVTTIVTDKGTIKILDGQTTGTLTIKSNQTEDVYLDASELTATIKSATGGNFESLVVGNASATAKVTDTITPIEVTITATLTAPKIINVNTEFGKTTGVKIYATDTDGNSKKISVVKGTNHDGFGVEGKTTGIGSGSELGNLGNGKSEKLIFEFDKDINSLDIAFAWRHNGETARVTFVDNGKVVGYAEVKGGGDNTKAKVNYYSPDGELIKSVEAQGGTDRVDLSYTFELPNKNGDLVSFDKVEFTAPNRDDDYLINKITYKEVVNPDVTDIVTEDGKVTFDIQIDEKYPPQGKATAMVEVNGKTYQVELNATGRGTLTIDSKELGDLSNIVAKVVKVEGGKYEKVNPKEETFKFTPTLKSTDDNISTDEDVPYTLTINDFGDITGISTKTEFKITELPTNGNLYLIVKKGETIFNPDGTKTEATEDVKIEITKDQVLTLGQVGGGKVVFEPTPDSDEDGSFKFQVGDGNGKFSEEYTTTIDVKAVADAPTVSIDVTKLGETTIVVDGNGNESNSSGIKALDILKVNPNYNGQETIDNDYSYSGNDDITKNYQNLNGGATNITTDKGNDTLEFQSLNSKNINSGAGDDKVIINQTSSSNNIQLGEGNNSYTIAGSLNSGTTQSGAGNDTLIVNQGASNTVINLGDGNNTISIGEALNNSNISTGNGNDTLIVGQASDNNTISTGGGNDFVQLNHNVQGTKIDLGTGNDGIRLSNEGHVNFNTETLIDGGADFDTLYLNGKETDYWIEDANHNKITYSQYVQENKDINGYSNKLFYIYEVDGNGTKQGSGFKIKNVEDIVFEKDAPKEVIIKAVEYKVDISAALTDKDGSETLSVVIKNVPKEAVLESTKYDVIKITDNSWSVNFKAGTTKDALLKIEDSLTMKVPQSYKGEINLQIEAKATEKNDNTDGLNFKTSVANDAVVITTDETSVLTVSKEATNIVLTLDVTSSMVYNDYDLDGDNEILNPEKNLTSLHILQKSAISTIEAYASKGETNVNMTIFSKAAHNLGWMTSEQAIAYLKNLTKTDDQSRELSPWEISRKLAKFELLETEKLDYATLKTADGTKEIILDSTTTNYKNAIAETVVKVGNIGKSGNNVGYFISDGEPWAEKNADGNYPDKSEYTIYEGHSDWLAWKNFIINNEIDLKVIGVGTRKDNQNAKEYLEDIQSVMGHKDIILIDEPTSMETIFLSTIDGTVSGDVSDNIFGGDGKVTIDSIVVGDTTYNKADYPYGLSTTDKLGGKLTFDFETGKYAYNGNGVNITTDMSKSFQVNVSDKNGDKGTLDVNFELKAQPITDGLVKFEKGGDINFSNLENIVNLKEINLDNGKENKLNLTLDDVLKLSGVDKQIKITGDQFDSVAFKNEAGNEWELKTENMGKVEGDKTFDVYTNSGDPTVQVKVEDKISDGITS